MPKINNIKTMSDLVAVATVDNLDNLLTDLREFLLFGISTHELPSEITSLVKPDTSTFKWIDDGKHEVKIRVKVKARKL